MRASLVSILKWFGDTKLFRAKAVPEEIVTKALAFTLIDYQLTSGRHG